MLKFAANLSFLYQELPFLDRFKAASDDGFKGVEYLFPYDWPQVDLIDLLQGNDLTQVLFNVRAGNWASGERGIASLAGRQPEFRENLSEAIDYANALKCEQIHIMAGICNEISTRQAQLETYIDNLRYAAEECRKNNINALIEPINIQDMPGYFLNSVTMATAIIKEINHPNLRLQFDMYHVQRTDGDICRQFLDAKQHISHIQIANPPHRYEPDNGEINYSYIFNLLEAEGYEGWAGCEYKPSAGTSGTLGWASKYLKR
jgi:hydroxypyruvate isomerase